ncbi:hypothetical protein MKW94_024860 [Papaver nudicaule]|uniref:Uncharacterized protein n=1 Tax=Papaver nudicaule TaxID=74823 RepID=A0AA42AYP7_PAPNU|nr:hypothetical protein [Papaver nudicaule]
MCKHWIKKKSADGTASRKHLVMPHRAGTMSFVNHAIEVTTKINQCRFDVYVDVAM